MNNNHSIVMDFDVCQTVTVAELSTKYGQAFKLHYTVHKGFHVQLKIPNSNVVRDFPPELESVSNDLTKRKFFFNFINIFFTLMQSILSIEQLHTKQNTCYLTTTDVNKLNIRIKKVIEEITLQTNVLVKKTMNFNLKNQLLK